MLIPRSEELMLADSKSAAPDIVARCALFFFHYCTMRTDRGNALRRGDSGLSEQ